MWAAACFSSFFALAGPAAISCYARFLFCPLSFLPSFLLLFFCPSVVNSCPPGIIMSLDWRLHVSFWRRHWASERATRWGPKTHVFSTHRQMEMYNHFISAYDLKVGKKFIGHFIKSAVCLLSIMRFVVGVPFYE